MLNRKLKNIKAIIPVRPPGISSNYLKMNINLDKLTIFVGPNASGKTTILQTIGYLLSGMLDPIQSSLGVALTKTLRPIRRIPVPMIGAMSINDRKFINSIVTPHSLLSLEFMDKNPIEEMITRLAIDAKVKNRILDEIKKDLRIYEKLLVELETPTNEQDDLGSTRKKYYKLTMEFIKNILEKNIDAAISDPFSGVKFLSIGETMETEEFEADEDFDNIYRKISRYLLRARPTSEDIKIFYSFEDSLVEKMILMDFGYSVIIFKKKKQMNYLKDLSVMVFHPGFVFVRGMFEGLYSYYAKLGFPRESKALKLLQQYLPWVKDYELLFRTLHLKTKYGKRISVYNLSDGQRVAVFMSLLYAISNENMIFLVDTPEAFVHPDGLLTVADFISGLVADGNQVLVATQSIEFLRRLLSSSKKNKILNNTIVEKVELSHDNTVKITGMWSGETSLNSIERLGLDLRK